MELPTLRTETLSTVKLAAALQDSENLPTHVSVSIAETGSSQNTNTVHPALSEQRGLKSMENNKHVLSFDPGLRKSGCALWLDGELVDCWLSKVKGEARSARAWTAMSGEVLERLPDYAEVSVFIYEMMQVYSNQGKRRGTTTRQANDLLQLMGVTGALSQGLLDRAGGALNMTGFFPKQWKPPGEGKDACHKRMWRKLNPGETEIVKSSIKPLPKLAKLDVLDAVSMGLYFLVR